MKTFRFKRFYKVYMDYTFWFNFPPPQIEGVDFKEIFLLSVPKNLILNEDVSNKLVSEILNKEYLNHTSNKKYELIERIRMYDREEYYPRERFPNFSFD